MRNDALEIGALDALEALEQRLGDEQRPRAAVAELVLVVLRGEQRVHRHRHDPHLDGAEEQRHPVGAVEHRDADTVFAPQVHREQRVRGAVDSRGELGVGAGPAVVDVGDLGASAGVAADEVHGGVVVARQLEHGGTF